MKTPINEQTIYDTVLTHLRKQGVASYSIDKGCMYRGPNGTKCAIGCLIPDDKYDSRMETKRVGSKIIINALPEFNQHIILLMSLQRAHDNTMPSPIPQLSEQASSMLAWEDEMELIAKSFDLFYKPIKRPSFWRSYNG